MIYLQREKPNTLPLDISKHWGIPPEEISRSSLTFTSKLHLGRTPQLCSPLTAMLNWPTTHPKKTYMELTIYIWTAHFTIYHKRPKKLYQNHENPRQQADDKATNVVFYLKYE